MTARLPIRAVIFDSDGTLVDSEVAGMDAMHEIARSLGVCMTRDEAHRRFRGESLGSVAGWIAGQLADAPDDFEQYFTQRYNETTTRLFRQELREMPGAFALLSALTVPFGVATNGPREKVLLTLELTGLLPLCGGYVFSAYDCGSFKPDPGLFLTAARALGHPPGHCAVVEDSLPGLVAGIAAGMQVFSLHPRAGVPDEVARRVTFIAALGELRQYL